MFKFREIREVKPDETRKQVQAQRKGAVPQFAYEEGPEVDPAVIDAFIRDLFTRLGEETEGEL